MIVTTNAHTVKHRTESVCMPNKYHPPPSNKPDLPSVVSSGIGFCANNPTAITPHIPPNPWTDVAPTGSSTPIMSINGIDTQAIRAPTDPIISAAQPSYRKHPAVIATRDPRTPLIISITSIFPFVRIKEYTKLTVPPPKDEIIVITAALAAYWYFDPDNPYVLPELKANHPHQRTKSPITALTGDPKGSGAIPLSYLPSLGPNISALAKADVPPIKCTGPDPAISTAPNCFRNPCVPQIQPAGTQYTKVFIKLNMQYALKLHLSAMAPLTIVVAVVANDI
uniref:Uncharacterized protein n=2 Tax=Photinus pyralis TaxID=7054 RepID=A0A1Y1KGS2_PHOPY